MAVVEGMSDRIPRSVLRRLPKHALLVDFPPDVQAEVMRIINAEASRQLLQEGDGDSPAASPRSNLHPIDGRGNQAALGTR